MRRANSPPMTVNAGATVVTYAAHGSSRQDFVDKLLDRLMGWKTSNVMRRSGR
jgi:hypothetical protein